MLWVNNANGIKHGQTQEQRSRIGMKWEKREKAHTNVSAEKSLFNRTKLIVGCVRMWLLPHFCFHFGFLSFASDGRLSFGTRAPIYTIGLYTRTHSQRAIATRCHRAQSRQIETETLSFWDEGPRQTIGMRTVWNGDRKMCAVDSANIVDLALFFFVLSAFPLRSTSIGLDGVNRVHASHALHTYCFEISAVL